MRGLYVLHSLFLLVLQHYVSLVYAGCDGYSPIFPPPSFDASSQAVRDTRDTLRVELDRAFDRFGSSVASYSVEVTSRTRSLFEIHHTARDRGHLRRGASVVDGSTRYRIASITKTFTVLALFQLEKEGRLGLDDPVTKYLPELGEQETGSLLWRSITIRSLASQLSGLPRDIGLGEVSVEESDPLIYGLPPIETRGIEICDAFVDDSEVCSERNLFQILKHHKPTFAPNQQPNYSNLNFDILGLTIARVSGMSYSRYVEKHILHPLNLTSTTFETPHDSDGALIRNMTAGWDQQMDVQRSMAGLYSSSSDMAAWMRYILNHYNTITQSLNWLNPASFSNGMTSFYGIPWEIFRTSHILPHTTRPVTLVTKSGGWLGYGSLLIMAPEYGFGTIIMTAGGEQFTSKAASLVSEHMVRLAERLAQEQLSRLYVGQYIADPDSRLNSSLTILHDPDKGLYISSWISNSTDVKAMYRKLSRGLDSRFPYRLQLIPSMLFDDEKKRQGEIWRVNEVNLDTPDDEKDLFSRFCITDINGRSYGNVPLNKIVFRNRREDGGGERSTDSNTERSGRYKEIELPAYRVRLRRQMPATKSNDKNQYPLEL